MQRVQSVDKYCPYSEVELYDNYNVTLYEKDQTCESYHVIQILLVSGKYIVWNRTGKYHNGVYNDERVNIYQDFFDNNYEAESKFNGIFKSKTRNTFSMNALLSNWTTEYKHQDRGYNPLSH